MPHPTVLFVSSLMPIIVPLSNEPVTFVTPAGRRLPVLVLSAFNAPGSIEIDFEAERRILDAQNDRWVNQIRAVVKPSKIMRYLEEVVIPILWSARSSI